jgi:hypothetical protein
MVRQADVLYTQLGVRLVILRKPSSDHLVKSGPILALYSFGSISIDITFGDQTA